jgi:hypothetical protein
MLIAAFFSVTVKVVRLTVVAPITLTTLERKNNAAKKDL